MNQQESPDYTKIDAAIGAAIGISENASLTTLRTVLFQVVTAKGRLMENMMKISIIEKSKGVDQYAVGKRIVQLLAAEPPANK